MEISLVYMSSRLAWTSYTSSKNLKKRELLSCEAGGERMKGSRCRVRGCPGLILHNPTAQSNRASLW